MVGSEGESEKEINATRWCCDYRELYFDAIKNTVYDYESVPRLLALLLLTTGDGLQFDVVDNHSIFFSVILKSKRIGRTPANPHQPIWIIMIANVFTLDKIRLAHGL